jgi:hypothetical protein
MDNFDLKKYLAEGTIHQEITEKKYKQGYDDREDESLGARKGAEKDKKVSMKGRRDDSYGKFGKRDAEAKGKAKGPGKNKVNKEGIELNEFDADVVAVGAPLVMSVVAAGVAKMGYDAVMDMIKKKFPREDAEYSAQEDIEVSMAENEVEESAPGYTHDCAAHVMHESHGFGLCLEGRHTLVETTEGHGEVTHYDVMFKNGNIVEKIPVNELKVLTSEAHHHGKYEEDDQDPKNESMHSDDDKKKGKMKMSELKAKIREDILSVLSEQEDDVDVDVDVDDEVEADVDVDVQDTVSVDAEGDDIEIEKKAVKAKIQVGLSPEEEIVQDSLKAAMDAANALGNEKLADQIGNTITFFTREYVVGGNTD